MLACGSSLRRDSSSKIEGSGVALPHYDSFHSVHSLAYFETLDDAAFFAVNSLAVFVLTASFNIHLLRPVASGDSKAIGHVVQASKNMFILEERSPTARVRRLPREQALMSEPKPPYRRTPTMIIGLHPMLFCAQMLSSGRAVDLAHPPPAPVSAVVQH
jgi:hypothetical protein